MIHIVRSRFHVITVAYPIWVDITNQLILIVTIFYTMSMSTLYIVNNSIHTFILDFSWIMHGPRNHTSNKGSIRWIVGQINEANNQLLIEGGVKWWRITLFGQLNSQLKRCRTRFVVFYLETFNITMTYLGWERIILSFNCKTWNPKKKHIRPRSIISKVLMSCFFKPKIWWTLFPPMTK